MITGLLLIAFLHGCLYGQCVCGGGWNEWVQEVCGWLPICSSGGLQVSGQALNLFLNSPICSSDCYSLFFWPAKPWPVLHTSIVCTYSSDLSSLHLSNSCLPEAEDVYLKGLLLFTSICLDSQKCEIIVVNVFENLNKSLDISLLTNNLMFLFF